jgi:hypothetical protein
LTHQVVRESKVAITRIPKVYRAGFAKIRKLLPSEVDAITASLEKASATGAARVKDLISVVASDVKTLKREDVEDVVKALYSLYVFRADAELPLPTFISDLTGAMLASGEESLAVPEQGKAEFENKMTKLLSLDKVAVASKIEHLKFEYPNTFHDARILSDIRPIFAKPDERPVGAAITHTLKIVYHVDDGHKEFYVTLDAEDLQKMKKILERAEAKVSSLRSLLKTADLPELS